MLRKSLKREETPSAELISKIKNIDEKPTLKAHHSSRRFVAVAAAAAILITVGTAAIAANFFGLRDLLLPGTENIYTYGRPDGTTVELPRQLISLQGFVGSPEFAAAIEWLDFYNTFDVESAFIEYADWQPPDEYLHYSMNSPNAIDVIDEIIQKHGLSLKGRILDIKTKAEFRETIAYGPLFTDDSIVYMGTVYESGSYDFFADYRNVHFGFTACRKGTFNTIFMNIGDINGYEQWDYTNVHGTKLFLAQNTFQSIMILETDTYFMVAEVFAGTEGSLWVPYSPRFNSNDLEGLADIIDFTQLRSEAVDMTEIFIARRDAENVLVSPFFGRWNHVKTQESDGTQLPANDALGLKIYEDRRIFLWHGKGLLEREEMDSLLDCDLVWQDGFWIMWGDVNLENNNNLVFEYSSMASQREVSEWIELNQWHDKTHMLKYDPATGLLCFTDWNGTQHFYEQES